MTPVLYCILIANISVGMGYIIGWLDARDKYQRPRDPITGRWVA